MDLMPLVMGAVIQGLVGLLFYLAVQRNLEKVDRLKEQLQTLERERIDKLEKDMDSGFKGDAEKRKKIYEELMDIRTHFVHVKTCEHMHETMRAQFEKFGASVIDLAKVQEKTEATARSIEKISEQVIALGQDLSRMEGKHERR